MKGSTSRQELQRQRAALDALTGEIGALKSDIGRAVYEIGTRLERVHDEALWRAGDYNGFEDYLARGVAISRSTAYRFMRIADHFNAEIARRYGPEKLDAAIRYLRATPVEERPGDLTRLSHPLPATTAQCTASTGRTPSELLDVPSSTPASPSSPFDLHLRHLAPPRDESW
jgi:hypothetical protein